MKEDKMNVEALSRAELLTLLSILEGELEAQDVVIHALRAQHRDAFVQERYGHYDLSDPFLALQRDSEAEERLSAVDQCGSPQSRAAGPNPLAVLKLVMAHCKRMQERMMGQLTAAESRHRRVIADLEDERRRCIQNSAQSEDFAAMMQTERDTLLQQLEAERAAVRRLEEEQEHHMTKVEESLSQQQHISSSLTLELHRASAQAQEEALRVGQLRALLQEESVALEKLREVLEDERSTAAQQEARSERRLVQFHTEREQMKARICLEEERSRELEREVEELRRRLSGPEGGREGGKEGKEAKEGKERKEVMEVKEVEEVEEAKEEKERKEVKEVKEVKEGKERKELRRRLSGPEGGREGGKEGKEAKEGKERKEVKEVKEVQTVPDGKTSFALKSKVNGHKEPEESGGGGGGGGVTLHPPPHSPSSTASSSLSSSPISSPVLTKRLSSPGFHQNSYQAGVNQRFQAARHKFQSQAELEQLQQGGALSPRDLSPTAALAPPPAENNTAKQLARNTVTQVLSRFTSQQAGVKLAPLSSSPFGTDYRSLTAPPPGGRSPSSGPLSPGVRSPLTPRSDRTHPPPPVPPKKPGMSPTPGSPSHSARSSLFPELTGNCGRGSPEGGAKEPDLVLSSSS